MGKELGHRYTHTSLRIRLPDQVQDAAEGPGSAPVEGLPPQAGEVAGKESRSRPLLETQQIVLASRPSLFDALGMDVTVSGIHEVLL